MTAHKAYRMNPLQWMAQHDIVHPFVVFNPTVVRGVTPHACFRREQHCHDGTFLFTQQAAWEVLEPILKGEVYSLSDPPSSHSDEVATYHLGWLRFIQTFPDHGVLERVSVTYRIEWSKP
jgi:hypothetical protein